MSNEKIQAMLHELELRRRDFHTFVKETFPDFIDGWCYRKLTSKLQQFMLDVRAKKAPRLIICLPPRMGKSQIGSVRFGDYCLLNNDEWEIVLASYNQTLAEKFSRAARMLLGHKYINSLWKIEKSDDHFSVREWKLGSKYAGGTVKAVGRGGGLTGSGSNVMIIDDPIKDIQEADSLLIRDNLWEWYNSVCRTRMAPGGGILLIQTRWHIDDLAGRLLKEQTLHPSADQWEVLSFPAIATANEEFRKQGECLHERFNLFELDKLYHSLPRRIWNALYQQSPTIAGGAIVRQEWLKSYRVTDEDIKNMDDIIQSWDLRFGKSQAASSSWVVGQVWGRKNAKYFLLDQLRGKWGFVESKHAVRQLSERWPQCTAKLVEAKANGEALTDDLQEEIDGLILFEPRGDKVQRLERVSPLFEAGNVFLAYGAPWRKEYDEELTAFPMAADDDQVDATSMALAYFKERNTELEDIQWIRY